MKSFGQKKPKIMTWAGRRRIPWQIAHLPIVVFLEKKPVEVVVLLKQTSWATMEPEPSGRSTDQPLNLYLFTGEGPRVVRRGLAT